MSPSSCDAAKQLPLLHVNMLMPRSKAKERKSVLYMQLSILMRGDNSVVLLLIAVAVYLPYVLILCIVSVSVRVCVCYSQTCTITPVLFFRQPLTHCRCHIERSTVLLFWPISQTHWVHMVERFVVEFWISFDFVIH